jgi:putative endonuclease
MAKQYFVYMLASDVGGTLYVGITSDLLGRAFVHREHIVDGFTKRYRVDRLVWFEVHEEPRAAIQREKQIKKWNRAWKIRLIEESNPNWDDPYPRLSP